MANHTPHIAACTTKAATNQSQSFEREVLEWDMVLFYCLFAQQPRLRADEFDAA